MANEPVITVIGTLGGDPDLKFLPSGVAVASFSIASTPRTKNSQTQEWEDGETLWLRASCWRQLAEHAVESLSKGSRVIVQGRLKQRTWQDKEGNNRVSLELDVDEIGPSLRYATAKVQKAARGEGGGSFGGGGGSSDPWSTPTPAGDTSEPPF
jgi:single-strand DNA-binding protein